jgi:hypothetical protein
LKLAELAEGSPCASCFCPAAHPLSGGHLGSQAQVPKGSRLRQELGQVSNSWVLEEFHWRNAQQLCDPDTPTSAQSTRRHHANVAVEVSRDLAKKSRNMYLYHPLPNRKSSWLTRNGLQPGQRYNDTMLTPSFTRNWTLRPPPRRVYLWTPVVPTPCQVQLGFQETTQL